jgi:HDOD domain
MAENGGNVVDERWTEHQLRERLARVLSPAVCQRVLAAMGHGDANFQDLADIIQTDPYVTAKVVAMGNFARHPTDGGGPIASIDRAVQVLGLRSVRMLMLSVMLTGPLLEEDGAKMPRRRDLWRWVIACSVAGQWVGEHMVSDDGGWASGESHAAVPAGDAETGDDRRAEYLIGGLMLGLGALVMYAGLGRPYARLLGLPIRPIDLSRREVERFGVSHHQVTVWAIQSMRAPDALGRYAKALADGDGGGPQSQKTAIGGPGRAAKVGRAIELLGARVAGYESDRAMIGLIELLEQLSIDSGELFGDQLRTLRRRARELADVFGLDIEMEAPRILDRRELLWSAGAGMEELLEESVSRKDGHGAGPTRPAA